MVKKLDFHCEIIFARHIALLSSTSSCNISTNIFSSHIFGVFSYQTRSQCLMDKSNYRNIRQAAVLCFLCAPNFEMPFCLFKFLSISTDFFASYSFCMLTLLYGLRSAAATAAASLTPQTIWKGGGRL